ncbi:magnesium transporter NIPA-domain-containing protein [Phanerochaete sordida]|uniref:Magnesium transporter NIPA-domain-containing protein n=1 Tax=Phanerochaete sordida TaxID=48140 RepID=A0A9P3LBG9_9APHY|nr:magnesium transporter NIPA-domain-containing protein [Phanerochaete sordida]
MATPSASAAGADSLSQPKEYRAIGVLLAIGSGVLIGSSFVFKKKGLLSSQKGHVAGEGVAYLKSPMWWTGMIIMILGELCNFAAYAFVEAIIVTPMGALSVVISSLLSHFILDEKLSLFGWIASIQCLIGSSILALNGPEEQSVNTIDGFRELFVTPWFLSYAGVLIVASIVLAVWVAPKYGKRSMLPYIGICSLIGGISVSCTQGLGACILTSIRGHNQFKNWFIYFLMILVVITLLTEIYYLNVALAMYNTAMVTPTYYVLFTFCTLVTSVILYQGLKASVTQIVTVVLAFLIICSGIFILQMSKVDPRKLHKVDEHTTLWLEVARAEADPNAARRATLRRATSFRSHHSDARSRNSGMPSHGHTDSDAAPQLHLRHHVHNEGNPDEFEWSFESDAQSTREIVEKSEEPGIDALRGTFGAIGTIIRAKRRMRALSAASHGSRSTISQDTEVRTSTNVRPSWLAGHWVTPKGSRFQPMHDDSDVEKGRVEITEVSEEENITEKPRTLSPETTPRSLPHHIHPATSSTIPLNAIGTTKSSIHFASDSISSDSLLSSENKHTSLTNITNRTSVDKARLA